MEQQIFFDTFLKNHPRKYIRVKYSYLASGNSRKAFFIFPGSGENEYSYYELVNHFEKKYKVIVINYLHFQSLDEFLEVVQEIIKRENIESIILYGLSLGGFLAQSYVRKYGMVDALILSHTGSMKSPSIRKKVIKPLKFLLPIIKIIPPKIFRYILKRVVLRSQMRKGDLDELYKKYASPDILSRSKEYGSRFPYPLKDRAFILSVAALGRDAEREELSHNDVVKRSHQILILKTDNDPLAQDDGLLKIHYPNATEYIFHETGHLTPFIQTEKMIHVMDEFLEKNPHR